MALIYVLPYVYLFLKKIVNRCLAWSQRKSKETYFKKIYRTIHVGRWRFEFIKYRKLYGKYIQFLTKAPTAYRDFTDLKKKTIWTQQKINSVPDEDYSGEKKHD